MTDYAWVADALDDARIADAKPSIGSGISVIDADAIIAGEAPGATTRNGDAVVAAGAAGWYRGDRTYVANGESYVSGVAGGTRTGLSVADAVLEFGLDYKVDVVPARWGHNGMSVAEKHFLLVTDQDRCVGTCGRGYRPIQNAEWFGVLDDIVQRSGYAVDRGGVGGYGSSAWIQMAGPKFETPSGEATGRITAGTSHSGNASAWISHSAEVAICRNYLTVIAKRSRVRMRHTRSATDRIEALRLAFEAADWEAVSAWCFRAGKSVVSEDRLLTLLRTVFPSHPDASAGALRTWTHGWKSARTANAVEQFVNSYRNAPGADPGTAWGVTQAVTHFTSHVAETRAARGSRFAGTGDWTPSRWTNLNDGSGAALQERVMAHVHYIVEGGA